MSPEQERDEMNRLCTRILTEKDPETFEALTQQLNDMLEANHKRFHCGPSSPREAA
jgi:hypothetical protein